MNAPNVGSSHRKPKPSLETFNLTPVVHVIEVFQHQQKQQSKTKAALHAAKSQVKIDVESKNSPRKRKISKLLEMDVVKASSVAISNDCSTNIQPISPISNSSTSSDPLASYMAEQHSDAIETPSPEVTPLPVSIFTTKLTTTEESKQETDTAKSLNGNDNRTNLEEPKSVNTRERVSLPTASSAYTHKLTKKMLMKYTPERFANK